MTSRRLPRSGGGSETLGALLVRLRLARGLSQLHLAELLCAAAGTDTVTRHEVSRWERDDRVAGAFWLTWLAVVLEAPLDRLEAAAAATHRRAPVRPPRLTAGPRLWRPPTAPDLLTALDQAGTRDARDLAHAWLAGPPAPAGAGPTGGGAAKASDLDGTAGDALDHRQARLAELRRQDDQVGGLDHADLVDRELRAAIGLLRTVGTGGLRRRALRVVAGYAQLAGWAHADAGDDPAARRAYQVSLRAAAGGRDRPFAAHVLGALSHLSLAADDPQEALLLARTAYTGARAEASALTQALLLHRIALAAARVGERRAAETALADADRAADRSDPEREPDWLYWLDGPELTAMTGRCLVVLGRPLRAVRLLAKPRPGAGPGTGPGPGHRTAVLYTAWLARGYVELGEVEQACRVVLPALRKAVLSGSARAAAGLRHLHPLLLRRRDLPVVRTYERRAADAFRFLAAPALRGANAGGRASVAV